MRRKTDEVDEDAFDPHDFLDGPWREIVTEIDAGDVDGELDAVEKTEHERSRPRRSVLKAIEDRRAELEDEEDLVDDGTPDDELSGDTGE
ncbi:hypothetical protein C0581_03165 [Candidatus Parcubacteria bacterium]|nr:MAG: hypothetical protein C0581_03165 [Candidatus Parcubacteria bacterium]